MSFLPKRIHIYVILFRPYFNNMLNVIAMRIQFPIYK